MRKTYLPQIITSLLLLFCISCTNSETVNSENQAAIGTSIDITTNSTEIGKVEITENSNESLATVTPVPTLNKSSIEELLRICLICRRNDMASYEFINLYRLLENRDASVDFTIDNSFYDNKEILDKTENNEAILYTQFRNGDRQNRDLYQYNGVTNENILLSETDIPLYAKYSPSNDMLLFSTQGRRLYFIYENGIEIEVGQGYYVSRFASFSPNEEMIAFAGESRQRPTECSQNTDYSTDIKMYLVDLNNNNTIRELDTARIAEGSCGLFSYDNPIVWSFDSRYLFYRKSYEDNKEIICEYDVNNDSENCFSEYVFTRIHDYKINSKNQLVISTAINTGNEITCKGGCQLEDIDRDIYVLDQSSKELTKVAGDSIAEVNPHWLQDERYIVYEGFVSGYWQIFVTDWKGSFHRQLTSENISYYLNGLCPTY